MKTYIFDIINKIQSFSERLDNLALLTNQHWVSIDEENDEKIVYIFRSNNQLLISSNGKITKERWEYLGNKSILIDTKDGSFLFKHGFFDENVLALKIDSKDEYIVFVNENKYDGELNDIESVYNFLSNKYLQTLSESLNFKKHERSSLFLKNGGKFYEEFLVDDQNIVVELSFKGAAPCLNNAVFKNGAIAPDGKYKISFLNYIHVKNGLIEDLSMF